jgi:hypothetical protein
MVNILPLLLLLLLRRLLSSSSSSFYFSFSSSSPPNPPHPYSHPPASPLPPFTCPFEYLNGRKKTYKFPFGTVPSFVE